MRKLATIVVMRNAQRNISFKVINPDFLLAEKD